MEEIINNVVKAQVGESSLAITKGYEYTTKDGKKRYSYNDVYYKDDGKIKRKHSNDAGDFYYNIELIDIVIESRCSITDSPCCRSFLIHLPIILVD